MKKIINNLCVWGSVVMMMVSCDKMNDIQQKYVDAGKRVYLGMTDSVAAFSGVGRVKLVWYVNADTKIEATMIYWNMRRDSIEKPFVRTQEGVQKDSVIIEGLDEDTYIFELFNRNQYGERSLTATVQGISYGEKYAGSLKTRPVASLSCTGFNPVAQSSAIKITWDESPEGCIESKITYKKRTTGEAIIVYVDASETETILTDVGNRLEHPDDVLYILSVYAPDGLIDPVESPSRKEQLVQYMASGTRIENAIYEGNAATFTYTYAHQDKIFRLASANGGALIYDCSRVAELSPTTFNTSFRITINEDQTVGVSGYFATAANTIFDSELAGSSYDPVTNHVIMHYTVKTSGGYCTVEETLIPKTTSFEQEAAKPFGDMRSIIPGDNNSFVGDPWRFECIYDGIIPLTQNGWLTANVIGNSTSFTIDLKEKMKLTRMIQWHAASVRTHAYGNANVLQIEAWGIAELDESKLSDASYWEEAEDTAGTFKEDWEYLGFYGVERLDKKNATDQEIIDRLQYGDQYILPESAGPVRYIRIYVRECANPNPAYFFLGELSFFGYTQ